MSHSSEDSSSSDEEYIPPAKTRRQDSSSDCTCSDDEVISLKDSLHEQTEDSKSNTGCLDDELSKKEREDKIWNEFLTSSNESALSNHKTHTVLKKKYMFAGELIEVTEPSIGTNSKVISGASSTSSNTSEPPPKGLPSALDKPASRAPILPGSAASRPVIGSKTSITGALQGLKSLGACKAPKLSTLEKSRLDWQEFVKNEGIKDDLLSHNKGKSGYLERQAFIDRTAEREYQSIRPQTKGRRT